MSDDSFIREVNEQLREDRAQEFWRKYGKLVIGAALAIVLGTAAWRGWEYYSGRQAATAGDAYMEAISLSNDGKHDEAIAALEQLGAEGTGQYPALAELRIASEAARKGDKEEAIRLFDEIAADTSFNQELRNVAKLRAGILAVDIQDYASVSARLTPLADGTEPLRHAAREAMGLSAFKAGDYEKALEWSQAISSDVESTTGVRNRASLMLNILAGKGFATSG